MKDVTKHFKLSRGADDLIWVIWGSGAGDKNVREAMGLSAELILTIGRSMNRRYCKIVLQNAYIFLTPFICVVFILYLQKC